MDELVANWESAIADLRFRHPDPSVSVRISVVQRPRNVRILFTLDGLPDSTLTVKHDGFEYYFYAGHFPGTDKARMWALSVWALFAEHEALELTLLNGEQLANPHMSEWCVGHRKTLDKRHDMDYMLARIWG